MGRRVLVVTTTRVDDALLRERVREHAGEGGADVKIVAPASDVSPLRWLASDEDEAREEAAAEAESAKEAVAPAARVEEAEVGDTDPLQATEDALRTFPADEIILVAPRGEEASWLEQAAEDDGFDRFGLPVTRLVVDGDDG